MSETPDTSASQAPKIKRPTLLTTGSGATPTVKLVSAATAGMDTAPKMKFLTPELKAQMEAEEAQRIVAEQEAARQAEEARIAAEQEAARQAEEARIAAEQEAARQAEEARIAAEQEAARQAEEARIAAEQEAARQAEEARIALEKAENSQVDESEAPASSPTPEGTNDVVDTKVQHALDQVKAAQAALLAAQAEMQQQLSQLDPSQVEAEPEAATIATPRFKVPASQVGQSTTAPTTSSTAPKLAAGLKPGTTKLVSPATTRLAPTGATPGVATSMTSATQVTNTELAQLAVEQTKSKKRNKVLFAIAGVIVVASGVMGYMAYTKSEREAAEKKVLDHLTELVNKGSEFGKTGKLIAKNGMVSLDENDAKLLLENIHGRKGNADNWRPAMHYLGMMAQLDENIAKLIIEDLKANGVTYTEDQFKTMVAFLSGSKKKYMKPLIFELYDSLSANQSAKKKLPFVVQYMTPLLSPADMDKLMTIIVNPDASKELIGSTRQTATRLMMKNPKEASTMGPKLLDYLNKAPDNAKFAIYDILGATGDAKVLQVLIDESAKNLKMAQTIYKGLSRWPSDEIVPILVEAWKNEKLPQSIRDQAKITALTVLSVDRDRKDEDMIKFYEPIISESKLSTDRLLLVNSLNKLSNRPYAIELLNRLIKISNDKAEALSPKVDEAYAKVDGLEEKVKTSPSDTTLASELTKARSEAEKIDKERKSELKVASQAELAIEKIKKKSTESK